MDIFKVDYNNLKDIDKKEFFYNFSDIVYESFNNYCDKTKILAQLLFINRAYNSHNKAVLNSGNSVSLLMKDGMNMLWDYLEDNYEESNFKAFSDGINAITLYLNTGDESENKDNHEFLEKYLGEWENSVNSLNLLNSIAALFFQICEENIDWYSISDSCLLGEILENVGDFLEDVYTNHSGGYKYDEIERRISEICISNTFKRVMSYLLEDLKQSVNIDVKDTKKIRNIHLKYETENLFSEAECEKLAEYFK